MLERMRFKWLTMRFVNIVFGFLACLYDRTVELWFHSDVGVGMDGTL